MEKKKKRKPILWMIGGVLVVATLILLASFTDPFRTTQSDSSTISGEIVTAFNGDLSAVVTASGQIEAQDNAGLSFTVAGTVESVNVRVGDHVKAGDLLAHLDSSDLELEVEMAQQNFKLAETELAALGEAADEVDVKAAEATVVSAQAALDQLLEGPRAEEIAAQEANLEAVEATLHSNSAQLNQVLTSITEADIKSAEASVAAAKSQLVTIEIQYTRNPDPDDVQANTALAEARSNLEAAQARLDTLQKGPDEHEVGSFQANVTSATAQRSASQISLEKLMTGPTDTEIAAAELQLAQAKATLANLLEGPDDAELRVILAQVEQARLAVEDTQEKLQNASLRAPYAGAITAVHVHEGEWATGIVIEMVAMENLQVILAVDEIDVGNLATGQRAKIALETWPEEQIPGEIVTISPSQNNDPGSKQVTYDVYLSIAETNLPIRVGMTANAELVTEERKDVVLVPNQAVDTDRARGISTVQLMEGDTHHEVEIAIGLHDKDNTEVREGLLSGDRLWVKSATTGEPIGNETGGGMNGRMMSGPFSSH